MQKTLLMALALLAAGQGAARADGGLAKLRVNALEAPLGIDTEQPTFSWQTQTSQRGFRQKSYQITVSDASGAELWNTGEVSSRRQTGIAYGGLPLAPLASYTWTVRVTGTDGTSFEASSTFGTAFMDGAGWTGQWITRPDGQPGAAYEITPTTVMDARYVRLNVTKLGKRASTDAGYSFVQLDEVEIYSGGENVARTATFTASNNWEPTANWRLAYVNDGKVGDATAYGWTTTQNPSTPITLTADLQEAKPVERIVLYPRQNDHAVGDETKVANFPAAFYVNASADGKTYTRVYLASAAETPAYHNTSAHVPYYGRTFTVGKAVSRARLYASALGVMTMRLNGQPVSDAKMEPGESEYEKTILYSTYDVTSLLRQGDNQLMAKVAGGLYNVETLTGRFSKGEVKNAGTPGLLAELHIDYADGTTEKIVTDGSWRCAASPTTGSNWWGGEDYDARLRVAGADEGTADLTTWQAAEVIESPRFTSTQASGFGTLRAKMYEPLRVVEEWPAVEVKNVQSGGYNLYVVDFGRNFAGQYRFRLRGKAGQQISLREGESLNADGSVYMENYYTGAADTYEVYTFSGSADGEQWGPELMYHGFRYLQIIGLDEAPDPSAFTAMRIRSGVEQTATMHTDNWLLDSIHVICRDAIASQLYNSITDCPHREKLGWLDVPNEMFRSLCYNFDMEAFYKKVVLDCFDSQYANGRVPSTVPHYMSVYDDDPNWGGAAILVPYRTWKAYGDRSLMEQRYDAMKRLADYYTSQTTGYLMNGSLSVLSDWGQETAGVSPMVPSEFTITTTYYYILRAMAEMATELGKTDDASAFGSLADKVKAAFNAKYYVGGTYRNGFQSELAMPLYYGLVEEAHEEAVAARLAARVKADGYKIKTGEIALKPLLMSLAKYGYNDVVYEMACQTDCPSYGYWVVQGYTTTPEYWNVGAFSQNHCMMDHIEEWFFSQLGGIENAGTAYDSITIRPYIPAALGRADISYASPMGTVRTAWTREDGEVSRFEFDVPSGSVATITVPVPSGKRLYEDGQETEAGTQGIQTATYADGEATLQVGSGHYRFTLGDGKATGVAPVEVAAKPNRPRYSLAGLRLQEGQPASVYIQDGVKHTGSRR